MDINGGDLISSPRQQSTTSFAASRARAKLISKSISAYKSGSAFISGSINLLTGIQSRPSFSNFSKRHPQDNLRLDYTNESAIAPDYTARYISNAVVDLPEPEPSFSKFKIPYQMICGNRYRKSMYAYQAQLNHEIRQNIDFQSSPADACYFMRCMAITSFWPPLHTISDVTYTQKHFFSLTEKEQWRLQRIMDTEIT